MKTSPRPFLILLILFCLKPGLMAQENKEPEHACFKLDEKRVLPLEMKLAEGDSTRLSGSFSFQTAWSGKQIFLSLPGTHMAYSIRINGFRFGSDPGSGDPSEYNITPFLRDGLNILEMEGSEVMEAWDLPLSVSGSLLIREPIHIRNLLITIHPGEGNEFLVRFHLYLKSYLQGKNTGRSILLEVEDPDGESIFREKRELSAPLSYGQETEMIIDLSLQNPRYWLPGSPATYPVQLSVEEAEKAEEELISTLFHISQGQVRDSLFIQNGDSVRLVYPAGEMEEQKFNAILMEGPLSCERKAFFLKKGILVLEKAE